MIDRKTREKIIKLWKDGESKTSIQRKTGVSQPTIRKILREGDLDTIVGNEPLNRVMPNKQEVNIALLEEILSSEDIDDTALTFQGSGSDIPKAMFVVNLSCNFPYGENPLFVRLMNGVPIWDLERQLRMILRPRSASDVMAQIESLGGAGSEYRVQVSWPEDLVSSPTGDPAISVMTLS